MSGNRRLISAAKLIRDHLTLNGVDQYCAETGIQKDDFKAIEPMDFEGEIFAIDGSNTVICDWSVANLNLIRAGYAVYKGRSWQRTVMTFDDVFWADPRDYAEHFDYFLQGYFGLNGITLEKSDLDRLSSYFRELHEYIALADAINDSHQGDLILYDGGFDVFEPLRDVLKQVLRFAEEKDVDLLGISKSSSLSWGEEISRPFVKHTSYVGSQLLPGVPWYLNLKDKNVDRGPNKWSGVTCVARLNRQSGRAFRVDVPSYLIDHIDVTMGKLAAYSSSAECLGYPHALFRAHRDIRITKQESHFVELELMNLISEMGLSESQFRLLVEDYHDVLEMRPTH
jgi:hypothetical protein